MNRKRFLMVLTFLCFGVWMKGQDFYPASTIYGSIDFPEQTVLYPEGFVASKGQSFSFNGRKDLSLSEGASLIGLTDASGKTSAVELNYVLSDLSKLSDAGKVNVLCFGESTTAIRCKNPYDGSSSGKNWVMMAQEELPSNIKLTGNIGHGGWSTYTYLNWPCAAKIDPHAPATFFKPETMWYALGLASQTGQQFKGDREQLSLIVLTPFGKNKMDGSEALWELLKLLGTKNGYPSFDGEGPYTGSKRQISMMRAWADELMKNPINEFYDRKTALKGHHAFSLEAYMKRSGAKRPTHVIVNIGINDGDGANSLESAKECFERLMQCMEGITTAHFVNRWPGVCDKGLWPGYAARQYVVNGNTANLLRLQKAWREVAQAHDNVYELDVWHCQYPASQLQEKLSGGVLDCSVEDVHTGYMGELTSSWQVVCWLGYVLCERPCLDVTAFGAVGDGVTDCTQAFNNAIAECSRKRGVLNVPQGRYLCSTIKLESNIELVLSEGAEILACENPESYASFIPLRDMSMYDSGDGTINQNNSRDLRWNRALVLANGKENITISGKGTINGRHVFDALGEESMRGPHALIFADCKNIVLKDFTITCAANYAFMGYALSNALFKNLHITEGWDGIHIRGGENVLIKDCVFETGDDSIAGGYWKNLEVSGCSINSSCNGIRMIMPCDNFSVHDCVFFGPGHFCHRTSREKHRTNMLFGIHLEPGGWGAAPGDVKGVNIYNCKMSNVQSPVAVSLGKDNHGYDLTIRNVVASGVYGNDSLPYCFKDSGFESISVKDCSVSKN